MDLLNFITIFLYGTTTLYSFYLKDYYYFYFGTFLTLYTTLYYQDKMFFREKLISHIFVKIHLFINYIIFLDSFKFWYYTFITEGIGVLIFKSLNNYYHLHNLLNFYNSFLILKVLTSEILVEIVLIKEITLILFTFLLFYNNLRLNNFTRIQIY